MPQFLLFISLFNELFPIAHAAVQLVEANAPGSAKGAQKFDAALTAVNSVVAAAPAAANAFTATKAALASGDSATVSTGIGHMIELSVSICKTFGLFPKAGIVQNAAPLPTSEVSGKAGD